MKVISSKYQECLFENTADNDVFKASQEMIQTYVNWHELFSILIKVLVEQPLQSFDHVIAILDVLLVFKKGYVIFVVATEGILLNLLEYELMK